MPTYDYRCKACGHELELFQSMSDKPKRKCPSCGKLKLERLIGMGGAVLFKGKGFWQTDYRSKSYTEGEQKDKQAAQGKGKDAAKSSEKGSKAAPKAKDGGKSTDGPTSAS